MKLPARMFSIVLLVAGALTTGALTLDLDPFTKLLAIFALVGSLSFLALKATLQERQAEELSRLRAGYEQLDQQAKLLIRTDVELHRTQEELDRKVASLVALHELSQQLRVSLHPDEIYGKLTAPLITSFGFSLCLGGVCDSPDRLTWRTLVGVSDPVADQIRQHLLTDGALLNILANPSPRTLDPQSAHEPFAAKLLELLDNQLVVVAGITPHAGPSGCLILARQGLGMSVWGGDEELVEILVTQLAIAIENSALYEELWHSRQELERKVHERTQELASANEQLLRLNKAKSDFVSAVSHELRTPLAAIKGYAALLQGRQFGPVTPPQAERLAKIEKHVDLLTHLINSLLDIARIESGRVTMEPRLIQTEELLATVLELVKPQLDAKHICFSLQPDGVTQLMGDPTHLPRIFINLLSNAVKYTPPGGSITLTLTRDGPHVVTTVQDSGCGIAAEELPKLFQEFYRAPNAVNEQVRGTGLGLALVKRIVEAHQGQIWAHSTPGEGSTFVFTLPVEHAGG